MCLNNAGEAVGYYALFDHEILRDCPTGRIRLGIVLILDGHRGTGHSPILLKHTCRQAKASGFSELYLATEHVDSYERFGFMHIGNAVYEHGFPTKVYRKTLSEVCKAG